MKSVVAPAGNALLLRHFSITYHKIHHRSIVHADFGQCQTIIENFVIEHKFLLEMWNAFMNSYLYFQLKDRGTGEHLQSQRISIHMNDE